MENQSNIQKSSFFGLNENIVAALVAIIPLALTFIPHVSYFGWIVSLIVVIFERKSHFAKFCAAQAAIAGILLAGATAVFMVIEGMVADFSGVPMYLSLCGIVTSIVRILCAAVMILVGWNGYSCQKTNIPVINALLEKII